MVGHDVRKVNEAGDRGGRARTAEPPAMSDARATWTVDGHRLTPLPDGPDRMNELLALIGGAQTSLRILYYIFEGDAAGTRVRDALVAAGARGVSVSLLVDGFGSGDAPPDFFEPLKASAGDICRYEPRWGRRYLLRNHQKMAIADGTRAIVGGFNIADDYFAASDAGGWRDLGLLVEGSAVARRSIAFPWRRRRAVRADRLRSPASARPGTSRRPGSRRPPPS